MGGSADGDESQYESISGEKDVRVSSDEATVITLNISK
jgi:hypothetical protein